MKTGSLFAAGVLSLALQGCATREECCVIPPYPAPGPDNNAQVLETAIDNLVTRTRAGGALYSFTQYSDQTVMQAQFDEAAMVRDFGMTLHQKLAPTSLPGNIGLCIKDHIVQAAYWDFQQRLPGRLHQMEPRAQQPVGGIFSKTWNNVALYCGVQNSEALKADVNEGWKRAADIVNSIKFGRY